MATTDMERLIELERSKLRRSRDIEEPYWLAPLASAISNVSIQRQKAAMWNRNSLNEQAASIPELAKLIRDRDSLDSFIEVSTNISNEMSEYSDLTPKANIIKQFASNMSSDYDMYSNSMEQGAGFIDDPNFIKDMQGWDDLENTVAKMTLEDGKTPKYQGNGSFLYLTEQSEKIDSIISRIQNSSKGTQFRYNKAGNKYTDAETIDKLTTHQKRIGVALEASMGDGIITSDEAEFIMLGDLGAYQKGKNTAIKRIEGQYKLIDKLQQSLLKEKNSLVGKGMVGFDANMLVKQITNELNDIQGDEDIIDTDISATTPENIMKQLGDRITTLHGEKDRLKTSFKGWSGRDWRPSVKVSDTQKEDFEKNVFIEDKDKVSIITPQIIDKVAVDEVKPSPPPLPDVKIVKTDFDEKQFRNQPETFPNLRKAKGKFVFSQDGDLKEWDNTAHIKDLGEQVPVLNAGYDNYYWYNGKWRHMKGEPPAGKRQIMTEKEARVEREGRIKALNVAKKGVMEFFGIPKTTVTKVLGEYTPPKTSKYGININDELIQSLWSRFNSKFSDMSYEQFADVIIESWGKLDKPAKSKYGSFNRYIKAMEEKETMWGEE